MQYVGNICAQKLEIQYKFSGVLAISMGILLYILSNWWKLIPTVRSGFLAVHNVNGKLGEQNLSWIEIKNLLTKPKDQDQVQEQAGDQSNESTRLVSKKNDRRVAYDCCRILFLRKGWGWVPVYYCISCFSSLLGFVASVTLMAVFWLKEDLQQNITFKCDIPEADTSHKTGEFLCSNDLIKTLTPYTWISSLIHVILFIANLISICVSIYSCCLRATHATDSIYSLKLYKENAFIKVFSNWSQRLNEQTTWLISNQYTIIKMMKENCDKAFQWWDEEFLSLYICMHEKNADSVVQYLNNHPEVLTQGRDHVNNFTLLFKASACCEDAKMFMKLHEIIIENPIEATYLNCGCEVLNLSFKQARLIHNKLKDIDDGQLTKEQLAAIKHILYWIQQAHRKIVKEKELIGLNEKITEIIQSQNQNEDQDGETEQENENRSARNRNNLQQGGNSSPASDNNVKESGDSSAPGGNNVQGGENRSVPNENNVENNGNASVPDGNIVNENGNSLASNGNSVQEGEPSTASDSSSRAQEGGNTRVPEDSSAHESGVQNSNSRETGKLVTVNNSQIQNMNFFNQ